MLLGQTWEGMQVWDVRRAIQALRSHKRTRDAEVVLDGEGAAGVVALHASLFEPNVSRLRLVHPPASHRDGPDLLHVNRFLDVPAAAAMALERSGVTIAASREEEWRYVQEVGERMGWSGVIRLMVVPPPAASK
jgi:hypothetical protein